MKEQKTKGELESMILAELNDPRVRVSVGPDPMGWDVITTTYGGNGIGLTMKAKQIAERLRDQYDLKED
jgi:hypothetical protein